MQGLEPMVLAINPDTRNILQLLNIQGLLQQATTQANRQSLMLALPAAIRKGLTKQDAYGPFKAACKEQHGRSVLRCNFVQLQGSTAPNKLEKAPLSLYTRA